MAFPRKTLPLAALLLATLSGCGEYNPFAVRHTIDYPPYEGAGYTDREPTEREKLIARSDFSVELVHFVDDRLPRSTALSAKDAVIYDYDPDQLLQGVTAKGPILINKYLAWRPKVAKHYRVEVELHRLHTRILTGTIISGNFGRYSAELEAHVVARRPDSQVVINRTYSLEAEQKRQTFNGRSPSVEMDRAREYDIAEDLFRKLAENIAWDLRQNDARTWKVEEDKNNTSGINLRPVPGYVANPAVIDDNPQPPATIQELLKPDAPALTPADPSSTVEDGAGPQG